MRFSIPNRHHIREHCEGNFLIIFTHPREGYPGETLARFHPDEVPIWTPRPSRVSHLDHLLHKTQEADAMCRLIIEYGELRRFDATHNGLQAEHNQQLHSKALVLATRSARECRRSLILERYRRHAQKSIGKSQPKAGSPAPRIYSSSGWKTRRPYAALVLCLFEHLHVSVSLKAAGPATSQSQ